MNFAAFPFRRCLVPTILLLTSAITPAFADGESASTTRGGGDANEATESIANLPNVLLIGDSISIGYTKPTIDLLKDTANVQRVKANCGDTNSGLKNLKRWLGDKQWDVIHFNWGLHDLCYRHPDAKVYGHRDKVNGTQSVPIEQYVENLETLVTRLKQTGATLIWASTTVVPEEEAGRFVGDEIKYNAAAAKIMQKHGVVVNDLHGLSVRFPKELFSKPGDVHFTKDGYLQLAEQVAEAITEACHSASGRTTNGDRGAGGHPR